MKRAAGLQMAMLAALMLLSPGCWVYSLHPLVERGQSLAEPALVGEWERQGAEKGTLTVTALDHGYRVDYLDKDGKTSKLEGALVQLGPNRYLDLNPHGDALDDVPEGVKAHLLPTHSFWKMSLAGDTLRLIPLNADWLEKGLKAKRLVIAHEMLDSEVVLRGPTPALRSFVQRYAGAAFPEDSAWVFRRK